MARTFFNRINVPLDQGYIPQIRFKLFGQWDTAIRTLNKLSPAVKEASLAAQLKVCQDICKRVKTHLRKQDLDWEPLNSEYLEKKEDIGFSPLTLIAYGTYYNNIETWQVGNQHLAFVGVRRGIYTKNLRGKRSRLDVATIAAVHEFSNGTKIPRRPLWNPTIREMDGTKGIQKLFVGELRKGLKKRGIPVKDFTYSKIFKK